MASLSNLMTIAHNPDFQDRIKYSMQKAAIAVMAEAGSVDSHALRVIYAKSILSGTASVLDFTIGFLTNSTIAANASLPAAGFGISDSDFDFVVNSMFNAFAGVSL